jgi:hypothetical protein
LYSVEKYKLPRNDLNNIKEELRTSIEKDISAGKTVTFGDVETVLHNRIIKYFEDRNKKRMEEEQKKEQEMKRKQKKAEEEAEAKRIVDNYKLGRTEKRRREFFDGDDKAVDSEGDHEEREKHDAKRPKATEGEPGSGADLFKPIKEKEKDTGMDLDEGNVEEQAKEDQKNNATVHIDENEPIGAQPLPQIPPELPPVLPLPPPPAVQPVLPQFTPLPPPTPPPPPPADDESEDEEISERERQKLEDVETDADLRRRRDDAINAVR